MDRESKTISADDILLLEVEELRLIFRRTIHLFYNSDLTWSYYEGDGTGTPVVRNELAAFRVRVEKFLGDHGGSPSLRAALQDLIKEVEEYSNANDPVLGHPIYQSRWSTEREVGSREIVVTRERLQLAKDLTILLPRTKPKIQQLTFQTVFGMILMQRILIAMEELGIRPVVGTGKGKVVAALHAACVRFQKDIPPSGQWPTMLEELYPGTSWSPKNKPELRPSYRPKRYQEAYQAMTDQLIS